MPHMIMVSFRSFLASLGATPETHLITPHVPEYIQVRLWNKFKDLDNLPPCCPTNPDLPFQKQDISKFCRLYLPEACITMVGYNLSYSDRVCLYFSHKGQLFTKPSAKRLSNLLITVPPSFDLFVCRCYMCKERPLCTRALVCEECIPLVLTGGSKDAEAKVPLEKKHNRNRNQFLSSIMKRFDDSVPVETDYSMSLRTSLEKTVKEMVLRKEIVQMLESYLARLNADLLATGEIKAKPRTIQQTGNNSRHFDWDIKKEYQHLYPTLKQQKLNNNLIYIPPAHRIAKEFSHTPLSLQIRDAPGLSQIEKTELYMQLDLGKDQEVLQALNGNRISRVVSSIFEDYDAPDLTELRNRKMPDQDMSFLKQKDKTLTAEEKRVEQQMSDAYAQINWAEIERLAAEQDDDDDEDYVFSSADV